MILFILIPIILFSLFLYSWYEIREEAHHRFVKDWRTFSVPKVPFKTISFLNSDGLKIFGWYLKIPNPKAVLILVHGHNPPGGKAQLLRTAEVLFEKGYSSFLIDLRAVGQSEGTKSTMGVNEWKDLDGVIDYLHNTPENKEKKIGLLGESGGAVTSIITQAITQKGNFLIAADPFASYKEFFEYQTRLSGFPKALSIFPRIAAIIEFGRNYEDYSPNRLISKIKVPVFIAWASKDKTVGTNQGSYLFKLANEPKIGWESKTPHDVIDNNLEEFHKKLFEFLGKYVI